MERDKWRYLQFEMNQVEMGTQFLSALQRAKGEGIIPDTVAFVDFNVQSILYAYWADPEKDLDLEYCKEHGIVAGRGFYGGGISWADPEAPQVHAFIDTNNPKVPKTTAEVYKKVFAAYADGVKDRFGVNARYRPLNDLEVEGKDGIWRKISTASCVTTPAMVWIGYTLAAKRPPIEIIGKAIPPIPEKFRDKEVKTLEARLTCLEAETGREVSAEERKMALLASIERAFEIELDPPPKEIGGAEEHIVPGFPASFKVRGKLTDKEKEYLGDAKKRYLTDEFRFERTERMKFGEISPDIKRTAAMHKVSGGPLIRVVTLTKGNKIYDILITGSMQAAPPTPNSPIHEMERALKGVPIDRDLIKQRVAEIFARPGLQLPLSTPDDYTEAVMKAATSE